MNTCAKFEVDIFKNDCARAFYIYMLKTVTYTSLLEFQKKLFNFENSKVFWGFFRVP